MYPFAQYALWLVPAVLEAVVVAIMAGRKMYRELPLFFSYALFEAGTSLLLLCFFGGLSAKAYFVLYWVRKAILLLLGVLVIYEIFSVVFRPYEALTRLSATAIQWITAALILFAVVSAAAAPGSGRSQLVAGLLVLERSVHVIQAGLLLFLFVFSSVFNLSWRNYLFGIAAGFGIVASVQLFATVIGAHFGTALRHTFDVVSGTGETLAVLAWAAYLLIPEPQGQLAAVPNMELEEWNQLLLEMLHR